MRVFAHVWDTRASSPGLRCARYSRYVPYRRPSREISRCRELKNMAATDSKTSGSVVMAASKSRVHFGIALDLELLAYVRSLNPFADPVQWTVIAAKMQDIAGMPFNARNVRSRTELLLSYYAAKDMVNLRKSGSEEQYSTREALLQELLDLSREHGVQIRRRRIGNAAPVPRDRCTLAPEAERKSAAAKRDAAAAMNVATQPKQRLIHRLQALLSATKAASQVDSSHVSTSQAAVRTEPVRGKKRQEQAADLEFLEKRMHHDLLMKEKECAMEARRLALEERRLAWEEERTRAELQLKEKEMEMKAQERTEERRMLAEQRAREQKERTEEHNKVLAQQQCLLSILERVLEKINK
ncbi:hypothetical protein HPB49_007312 [Dermacentor silvarum]|uniref:Uncharacterized protein n=1 Tax=Dermacentor silvarum TaxID=543639 RepID=A0ACB8CQK4_DERSI|nr:hypothetical protein HPB49_007312 [Dermacentor silvarum]